jgi:hypothetical protein
MGKSLFASKTMWFNALSLGAALLAVLVDHELVTQNPATLSLLLMIQSGVNMVLRFVTTKPITTG